MNLSAPVRLLNSSFTTLAEFDEVESSYFSRSLYKPGRFEIRINYNLPNVDLFARDLFVLFGSDTRRLGIITSVKKKLGKNGKIDQTVTIGGYELRHIFERRIVVPPIGQESYYNKAAAETVIKQFLASQCIGSSDADRNFAFLQLAADSSRGSQVEVSARLKNVGSTLWDLAEQVDMGISIPAPLSGSVATVDVIVGVDRRSSQSVNPRAIFSVSSDTAGEAEISDAESKFRNFIYAAGQGAGTDRTILEVYSGGEPTGLSRREMYLDARDLADSGDLLLRAQNKLAEYGQTLTLDVEALQYSSLQLGTDYDLGDLCTIEALGVTSDVRITEVKESWANGKYEIDLSFGKPQASITSQVASIYNTGQSIQNFSEFGQNGSITNVPPQFIDSLFTNEIKVQSNGSIRGGDRYDESGATVDGTKPGFYIAASGACKVAGIEFEGSGGGGVQWGGPAIVGSPYALGPVGTPTIVSLNGSTIAYVESGADTLALIRFNGSTWSALGINVPVVNVIGASMAALNGTDIAYIADLVGVLRVYRNNGTNLVTVGNALTIPSFATGAMAALNNTDVAISNNGLSLTTYRFDGTNWAQIGNTLSIVITPGARISALNSSDIAYLGGDGVLRTYRFNGTDWSAVGAGLAIPGLGGAKISSINGSDIALVDPNLDVIRLYRFDGANWFQVGSAGSFSVSSLDRLDVTALNGSDIVIANSLSQTLSTYRFSFATSIPYARTLTGF